MKLTILAAIVLFAASASSADDRVAQSQSSQVPAQSSQPATGDYDKAFRGTLSDYALPDYEFEIGKNWRAYLCTSDGPWSVLSWPLKKMSPDRYDLVFATRKSIFKYLSLAKKDEKLAAEKIWQEWHDIPNSEKEGMGKLEGKGVGFLYQLAFDCGIVQMLIDNRADGECSANGELLNLYSFHNVCIDVAGQHPRSDRRTH